jgi:hypothetical protein
MRKANAEFKAEVIEANEVKKEDFSYETIIEELTKRKIEKDSSNKQWLSMDDKKFIEDFPIITKTDLQKLKSSLGFEKDSITNKKMKPREMAENIQKKLGFTCENYAKYEKAIKSEIYNANYGTETYVQVSNEYEFQLEQLKNEKLLKLKEKIKYVHGLDEFFIKWCNGFGITKPLDQYVFKHCLWLVKRNVFDLPTGWEMLITFWGAGGTGKSTNLSNFMNSVFESDMMVEDNDFTHITDPEKYGEQLTRFVWILQDVSKVEKADKNSLKNVITSSSFVQRKFHTQKNLVFKRKATFFITSNQNLKYACADTARRYWNIQIENKIDYAFLNKMKNDGEIIKAWQSIDENSNIEPINSDPEKFETIRQIQESELRNESIHEQYLEEKNLIYNENAEYPAQKLYDNIREFAYSRGYKFGEGNKAIKASLLSIFQRKYKKDISKRKKSGWVWHLSVNPNVEGEEDV